MTPPWQSRDLERSERPRPDRARRAKEATYRFKTTIAGDLPGYEAAVEGWPEGVAGVPDRPFALVIPDAAQRRSGTVRYPPLILPEAAIAAIRETGQATCDGHPSPG